MAGVCRVPLSGGGLGYRTQSSGGAHMTASKWPWPTDTRTDKLRRIIDHYRSALAEADLDACLRLDKRMADYGQSWVSDNSIVDVNAMMSAKAIAEQFGLEEFDVRNWAKRHPERIRQHKAGNGRMLFQLGDVLTYNANKGE